MQIRIDRFYFVQDISLLMVSLGKCRGLCSNATIADQGISFKTAWFIHADNETGRNSVRVDLDNSGN